MSENRHASMKFQNEDDEDYVLDAILECSVVDDVAIYKAIDILNPHFQEKFGMVINKGWFSHRIRKSPEWYNKWTDTWQAKAAHRYEKLQERAEEFEGKMYKNETYETYDKKGEPITVTRRVLQKTDIAAYQALDQAERRTIAQLMPGVFRTTYTPEQGEVQQVNLTVDLRDKTIKETDPQQDDDET